MWFRIWANSQDKGRKLEAVMGKKNPNKLTTKLNLRIVLGMPERTKPSFLWIKGVVLRCLTDPWLYFKLFPRLRSSQCRFSYFQYRQNSQYSFALSRLSSFPFLHNLPELHMMKTCTSVTHQLKWKSNSQNRVREHSESFYLKECWVCAPAASVLPPAMLPAWFPPPALHLHWGRWCQAL